MRLAAPLYAMVLLLACWAAWPARIEGPASPARGARPLPSLGWIDGMTVELEGGSELRADRVRPHQGEGLALGGSLVGLELERPLVRWPRRAPLSLAGERGRWTGRGLELEGGVRLSRGALVLMETPRCLVSGPRVAFPGIAVWAPGTPEERVVRAGSLDIDHLPPGLR